MSANTKKVTVNLPEEQVLFLQKSATREGLTFTDVLRRAINAEKFFLKQEELGNKILVETEGGQLKEIIRC